ncbi:Hypothetical predicted protein [Olea europaea subsp. europaea]|uniref:Uncharacterized protein n=1 Tax=Olea europaea subsp. europaea TaxID=158383 RepID=A0A8S0PTV9_OLEEU|nr:Hypothetical predicted protein [Olea europaea subsp. europaea]
MELDFQVILGGFQVGTQPDFQAFLGNFWDLLCRPSPGRVMATAGIQSNFQSGLAPVHGSGDDDDEEKAVSWMQCAGHDQDAIGTQLDFKFLDTVYRPRPGCLLATVGTQPDFQAFVGMVMFGTRLGRGRDAVWFSSISKQFLGNGVEAMSRMLPCPGRVPAMIGMEPDFQAFQGNIQDTERTPPDFQAFMGSFGALCAGQVRDASYRGRDAA